MVCLVDDEMLGKYRRHEEGITAAHVVDSFDIFKFEAGKQGTLSRPSKTELSAAFGTASRDEAIEMMLEKGEFHRSKSNRNKDSEEDTFHLSHGEARFHVQRSGRPL